MNRMESKELEGAADALGGWLMSQELSLLDSLQVMVRTINLQLIHSAIRKHENDGLAEVIDLVRATHKDISAMLGADALSFIMSAKE
jgi:hypothetical protein